MNDSLIVTYDCCATDVPTLCIARKENEAVKVVNLLEGDDAFGTYHLLTGGATADWNNGMSEVIFQLQCVKEHLKFVSKTIDKSVDFDTQVLEGCIAEIEKWMV